MKLGGNQITVVLFHLNNVGVDVYHRLTTNHQLTNNYQQLMHAQYNNNNKHVKYFSYSDTYLICNKIIVDNMFKSAFEKAE